MKGMMRSLLVVGLVILLGCLGANGQSVSASESLKVMQAVERVFRMFENPDYAQFEKESTDWIYCILCRQRPHPKHYYMMRRKEFFKNHIESLNDFEDFRRAKKSRKIVLMEKSDGNHDFYVCLSAWERDEWVEGHGGSCLGLFFTNGEHGLLFSGIETIP